MGRSLENNFELEEISCNLCGSHSTYLIGTKRGQISEITFRIVKCKNCGLTYVNPRLTRASLGLVYNQEYYGGLGFDPCVNYFDESFFHGNRIGFMTDVRSVVPFSPKQKLLDIGCGLGNLLAIAKEVGYICYGIDVSPFAVKYVQNRFPDIRIFEGDLGQVSLPERDFDVITAIEVVEHLHDPMSFFKRCALLLRHGGVLAYTTMNSDRMYAPFNWRQRGVSWGYINPEGHLYYFDKSTILSYFRQAGLTPIDIYKNGLWRHRSEVRASFKRLHIFAQRRLSHTFYGTIYWLRDKGNGNIRLPWARLEDG